MKKLMIAVTLTVVAATLLAAPKKKGAKPMAGAEEVQTSGMEAKILIDQMPKTGQSSCLPAPFIQGATQIGVCYNTNYCDCIKPCDCGIVPISAKDRGILFNDFIDKLAKGWCGVDECHLCYARLTHQCGTMVPSIGDISGQFGAMWNDRKTHYNGYEMSGLRSGHSTKFHAPLFGYANTVLGGFGQNVAFYPEREFGLRVGRMNAKRTIVAAPRYMGCGCRPIGYCIDNSGYCWAFCVAEQEKYANRSPSS